MSAVRMKRRHINEIKGIIVFAIGLLILASLISYTPDDIPFLTSHPNAPVKNVVRIFGAYLAFGIMFSVGWAGYCLAAILFLWAWNRFLDKESEFRASKFFSIAILISAASSLMSMLGPQASSLRFIRGGFVGMKCSEFLVQYFGRVGAYIILSTIGLLSFVLISELLISPFVLAFFERLGDNVASFKERLFSWRRQPRQRRTLEAKVRNIQASARESSREKKEPAEEKPFAKAAPAIEIKQLKPVIKEAKPVKIEKTPLMSEKVVGDYALPTLDLLEDPPPASSRQIKDDLMGNARILEETLADFGVTVRVADIERGPVITRYELEPAPGVKVQRISSLADDIALTMKSPSVRIVAPIPGKSRVGIEVPNTQSSIVYLKEIFSHNEFRSSDSKLMLALGKDIAGEPVIADLSEMPHLLIAGTTGSGKTVCVNSIIMSMLYRSTPQEIKFVMVDPKMVELAPFNGLPHLLCPVITDAKKVSSALGWVVSEMESRFELLAKAAARNIDAYNEKNEKMPYIVVVIDELADLMVVAAAQIENAITRLAQLSRAVGIHLILATQRPSVDVITGVIKANFPARISFKVASKVDSRTVLDMNGADKLLGRGDMLFIKPGDAKPVRAQGSLVQDKEIDRVVDFIRNQQKPAYNEEIMAERSKGGAYGNIEKDELYDEAVRVILESKVASTSILQRRLRLGYGRAARIIDVMEQEGIIGPFRGATKPRDILTDIETWSGAKKDE